MVEIKKITVKEAKAIWLQGYSEPKPKWVEYDAPFLHSYQQLSWQDFQATELAFFLSTEVRGIYLNNEVIGAVTYYWENKATRWLEVGLAIFDTRHWSKGYGSEVLTLWTTEVFELFPEIERVGLSTWSGNPAMISVGKKVGYHIEGTLRKVRYYQGTYYDSVKMGVLRNDWLRQK